MKECFYFIFTQEENNLNNTLKQSQYLTLQYSFILELQTSGYRRLFEKDISLKNGHRIKGYIVTSNMSHTCLELYNGKIYEDCNTELYKFFNNHKECFGYASITKNRYIKALLFGNTDIAAFLKKTPSINQIFGENEWKSLEEFFIILKESQIVYVVLRKYENLPSGFIEGDKDIDILCADKEAFVSLSNAEKRSLGISGYKIRIDGQDISLDIRFVGDHYYPTGWQEHMLLHRQFFNNLIPIMSHRDLFFSIIYHVYTQKKEISEYYIERLEIIRPILFNDDLKEQGYLLLLAIFMKSNGYRFVHPMDCSVIQNKKNIKYIQSYEEQTKKKLLLNFVYLKLLHFMRKLYYLIK